MENIQKIIVSTLDNKTSGRNGYEELKEVMKRDGHYFKLIKWQNYGTFEIETDTTFENFSKICDETFFIRHIFPVDKTFHKESSLDDLEAYLQTIDYTILSGFVVGVQGFSFVESDCFKKSEVALLVEKHLKEHSLEVDNKNATYVFSFIITRDGLMIGLSSVKENLCNWILGNIRLKKDEEQISRASFKLDEAFEAFNITEHFEKAIDLGASPGGWTKVLADKGIMVSAVDPANLDDRLKKNPNVKFYNMLSQEFVSKTTEKFDLIVNDMKMDVVKSCEITCELEKILVHDGFGIITFKLPENKQRGKILDGLRVLSVKYDVIKVKQLHHNRHEVTVLFQKRRG